MKTVKKLFCIVLCLYITVSTLVFASAGDSGKFRFFVTSDTHLQAKTGSTLPENTGELAMYTEGMLNNDKFYYAAQQGQMNYESYAIIKSMLSDFERSDSEVLLIAGDLTNGKRQSHIEMAQLLTETEKNSGKKIFVVPGNHDCAAESSGERIDINEFKQIYREFGFSDAIDINEKSASYAADISAEYRLLAIDSCIYGEDDGELNDEMQWIKEQAEKAKNDGKTVIAMMHHSILPHFYVQPMIKKYSKFTDEFSKLGINIVFTGHIHANDISSAKASNGRTVYDVQTGSLITAPCAYREVAANGDGFDIKTNYVTKINVDDLPEGYSDEQLSHINENFTAYANELFEAGVCRWLNRYIGSAGKVGKMLKLKQGDFAYEVLDGIMKNIGNALNTPIYDDGLTPGVPDSIEEIADKCGITVPESKYIMPYQLAARVMGSFYCGDEETQLANGEIDLLFICIKSVLAQALTDLSLGEIGKLARSVFGDGIRNGIVAAEARFFYSDLIASKAAQALIESLTAGLTSDFSDPSDLNTTIELEMNTEKVVPLKFFDKLIYFFRLFISIFRSL